MRKFTTIHIPIPQNLPERYRRLFIKKSTYKVPELQVKEYKNVFVSHEGLCLQNFRLVPYSSFNICTRYDKSFGWQYYKLVLEQYLVSTFGKSLKKITLPADTTYAVIHTKWFNYFFWITSSLHRLIILQQSGKEFTLLYPEEWDSIPYVTESMKAFPNLKIHKIPTGVHLQVPHLLMPEVRPYSSCLNPKDLLQVKTFFYGYLNKEKQQNNFPSKIYISREKANRRRITNELEITTYLKEQDFSILYFEELSLYEQIAYMQHADIVISLHGAGLTNILFMNSHGKVIELSPNIKVMKDVRYPFWRIATLMNLDYSIVFDENISSYDDDITIQINKIRQHL